MPAYAYRDGLERILTALSPLPADIQLLIFDDTPDDSMSSLIERFRRCMPGLYYQHNPTALGAPLGAGANWNSLLDAATGEYVLLMHHDEVPLNADFLEALRVHLTGQNPADVLMLDLMLVDDGLQPLRRHVPSWLRRLVPRHWPGYLFRRNVVGPTATLVIRSHIAPRFDPNLQWLIDVDFYMRLCKSRYRWAEATEICIGSVQRREGTITVALSEGLAEIDAAERKVLAKRYPEARLWLGAPLANPYAGLRR